MTWHQIAVSQSRMGNRTWESARAAACAAAGDPIGEARCCFAAGVVAADRFDYDAAALLERFG